MYWMNNWRRPGRARDRDRAARGQRRRRVNGLITVWLNVPSFVTTLATNFILFGLVLIWSDQTQATPIPLSSSDATGH